MKRKALFIGVNEYEDPQIRDLNYSLSDAHALKTLFELLGYETDILENPVKSDVFSTVRKMTRDRAAGDLFFLYFAGHGWTTTTGKHLLFCSDDMYEDLRYEYNVGIPFDILKKRTETGGYNRAFVLDACRSDFITGTRGDDATTRDLRPIGELVKDAPTKSSLAVLRSCSKYEHALEIASRKQGLFTLAMMDVLRASMEVGTELLFGESLCDAVTQKMADIARAEGIVATQTPEFAKSGIAQVLISGRKVSSTASPSGTPTLVVCPVCGKKNDPRETFKCRECGSDNLCLRHQDDVTYLCTECSDAQRKARDESERKAEAERRAREEADRKTEAERKVRKEAESKAREVVEREVRKVSLPDGSCRETGVCRTITLPGGAEIEMIYCPPGEFMMGSPNNEDGRNDDETQHRVLLTKGFWLGKYPVTQRQWQSVMGGNPSSFKGEDLPVETVSWDDCQEFIKKVNAVLGCGARLPTEAEWEYACRAGTTSAYFWGNALNGDRANCCGNYPCGTRTKGPYLEKTTPVGKYGANPWGLCDMHGSVWEWCADWLDDYFTGGVLDPQGPASGGNRVLRGGGWCSLARRCRSAYRCGNNPGDRFNDSGFRLCCSAAPRGPGAEP